MLAWWVRLVLALGAMGLGCSGPAPVAADAGSDLDVPGDEPTEPACAPTETVCGDGIDEDCDGLMDCADPECALVAPCCIATPEICDGIDNDCSGRSDELPAALTTTVLGAGDRGLVQEPQVVAGGGGWTVVFADSTAATLDLFATRATSLGDPVGVPVNLTQSTADSVLPAIAWTAAAPSPLLLAWSEGLAVRTAGIDPAAPPLPPLGATVLGTLAAPAVATGLSLDPASGTGIVLWGSSAGDAEYAGVGADALVRFGPSTIPNSLSAGIDADWAPAAGLWGIAFSQVDGIHLVRVQADGTLLPGDRTFPSTRARSVRVAWNAIASEFALVWLAENATRQPAIVFARADAAGTPVGSPVELVAGATRVATNALGWAFDSLHDVYALFWVRPDGSGFAANVRLLDEAGASLYRDNAIARFHSSVAGDLSVHAAYDPSTDEFGVVWTDLAAGGALERVVFLGRVVEHCP